MASITAIPPSSAAVTLKIFCNGDIRRCSLSEVSIERVRALVRELYPSLPSTVSLKFADDEDELVTVSSTGELREALALLNAAGHKVLKLHVTAAAPVDEPEPSVRSPSVAAGVSGNDDDFILLKPAPVAIAAAAISPVAISATSSAAPAVAPTSPSEPKKVEGVASAAPPSTPSSTSSAEASSEASPTCDEIKELAIAFISDASIIAELPSVVTSVIDSLLAAVDGVRAAAADADKKAVDAPSSSSIIERALASAPRVRASSLVTRLLPLLPSVVAIIDDKLFHLVNHAPPHIWAMVRAYQPLIPELVKKATEAVPQLLVMLPMLRNLFHGGAAAGPFGCAFPGEPGAHPFSFLAGVPLFGGLDGLFGGLGGGAPGFCGRRAGRPFPFGGPHGHHHGHRHGHGHGAHHGHHHHGERHGHHGHGPFGGMHHMFRGMMHGMPPPPPFGGAAGHHFGAFPASPSPFCAPFGGPSSSTHGPSEFCGRRGWGRFGGASSPAATPASSSEGVHVGINCDGCGEKPLKGIRWHCSVCPDFDLCGSCEAKQMHAADHPLIKMRAPAATPAAPVEEVHRHISCDGCGVAPILGIRWKCSHPSCPDYDLCNACEAKGVHPDDHALIKMRHAQRRHGHGHGHHGAHGPHHGGRHGHGRPEGATSHCGRGRGFGGFRRWAEAMAAATTANDAPVAAAAATPSSSLSSTAKETKEAVKEATVSSSAATSAAPIAATPVAATPVAAAVPSGRYDVQLAALASMGFTNVELNTYLLDRNHGNLQTVANWLIEKQIAH